MNHLISAPIPGWPSCDCLSIEVTTNCNSACSHCFVRARNPPRSSLPADLVKGILREAYETGYRHLHLTGGEPLLWEGLTDTLDTVFGMGYQTVFLNTNGTLLRKPDAISFAGYDGLSLSVSLQGPIRLHDRIRGKGSYDRATRGVDHALNAGVPVHLFTTIGRTLLPDLPQFANELINAFPRIEQLTLIQMIRVPNDALDLSKEVLRPEDFLRLVRMISLLNLFGLRVDLLNNPLATVVSRVLQMPWVPPSPPLYRPGSIMITVDLQLALSHSSGKTFGRYERGMIRKILGYKSYRRATAPDRATCPKCRQFVLCRSGGMVRPSEWYRDMHAEVPYCKRVMAKALFHG
jgi:MoaA/NifB/PqqE/SkfB family radical SAM enzyme